jgi:hypothetical protein
MTAGLRSEDPDQLQCYSDHASDIAYYGNCSMCDSDDKEVVGHVLPAVPRVMGMDPIAAAELVMSDQTMRMFDGVLLDTFSASAILAVYKALNEENQKTMRSWPLVKAADASFRLLNRSGARR